MRLNLQDLPQEFAICLTDLLEIKGQPMTMKSEHKISLKTQVFKLQTLMHFHHRTFLSNPAFYLSTYQFHT